MLHTNYQGEKLTFSALSANETRNLQIVNYIPLEASYSASQADDIDPFSTHVNMM